VAPIEVGIVGRRAVCIADDSLIFVGQTDRGRGYVYQMKAHQPVRISDQAVEEALNASDDMSQVVMWTYHVEGNEFVGIHAPGMETTRVWDASVRQWHERGEMVNGEWAPVRVDQLCAIDGQLFASAGNVIYEQHRKFSAYGGDEIVFERTWPHLISPAMEPISYRGLEVACTTGVGRASLEISNDGGYTFLSPLLRTLGAIGRRMERVRWLGLGTARDRVFRLRFYGCGAFTLHSGALDV
jgi:hypothetical protein